MHPESNASRETELSKPSKLQRIKNAAVTTGMIAIPVTVVGVSMYYGIRTQKMQFEITKLVLEGVKNAAPTE